MRLPTRSQKPREAQVKSWPAPRNGWIANRNLAQPGARNPDGSVVSGALILDNFFPTATTARLRRGYELHADIGGAEVDTLFAYIAGTNEKLFAADAGKIANIGGVMPVDEVTGLSGGDWISAQFASSGGIYLRLVNGTDTPLVYDGTDFDTFPALTFAGAYNGDDTSILNFVWPHGNRLFFVEKDSLNAWYLPVGQIGGELTQLPLGGVFERGGSLLFGAIWSNDSGAQGGLSQQVIFVSSEGEVAVFQGSNPGDVNDWRKVGVYRIGRPLGKRAWFRAGGDIMIATSVGLVPLSAAVTRDFAAIAPAAISYPIEDAWNRAVHLRGAGEWRCELWPTQQMALIIPPFTQSLESEVFVVNVRTGAWCRFTGWDVRSTVVFKERLYFGAPEGQVMIALSGGQDGGEPYAGVYVPLFDDFGTPTNRKIAQFARASIRARQQVALELTTHADFIIDLPTAPQAVDVLDTGVWGAAFWGSSNWGEATDLITLEDWQSVSAAGTTLSAAMQVPSDDPVPMDVEIVRVDVTYTMADIVT